MTESVEQTRSDVKPISKHKASIRLRIRGLMKHMQTRSKNKLTNCILLTIRTIYMLLSGTTSEYPKMK